MDSRHQYDELLTRFLANGLNREEEEKVQQWLSDDPENQHYFNDLIKAWRLADAKHTIDYVLNEIEPEDKWQQFKLSVIEREALPKTAEVIVSPEEDSEEVMSDVPVRKISRRRGLVRVAVAAAVILSIVMIGRMLRPEERPGNVVENKLRKDTVVPVLQNIANTSGKEKEIKLPDGSLVILADKSSISYRLPFEDLRNVVLDGKAFFSIAKDSKKPFTVTSREVATTVLGTEFLITAFAGADKILVRLFEGKVVVNAVEKNNRWMKQGTFLSPGQEFIYSYTKGVRVWSFRKSPVTAKPSVDDEVIADDPLIPKNARTPWFMFNNQLLADVLEQLSGIYGVQILYKEEDVKNKYFIGKFNRTDSLDIILKYITEVNGLRFTRNENVYHIEK